MSCWCCVRGQRVRTSKGDPLANEKIGFESVREQMINDFVAAVSADAVKRFSEEQGLAPDSMQDEVFADNAEEVTRDLSQMVSRFYNPEADDSDDGLGEDLGEDRTTKQRISQILDMGVYQPGISFLNRDSVTDSEPESESGVSLGASSKRSSRKDSSDVIQYKRSLGYKQFSTMSNPRLPLYKTWSAGSGTKSLEDGGDPETQGRFSIDVIPEDAKALQPRLPLYKTWSAGSGTKSLEDGGDPETQGRFSIDVIPEDAKALQQAMMDRGSTDIHCLEKISPTFLDNVC